MGIKSEVLSELLNEKLRGQKNTKINVAVLSEQLSKGQQCLSAERIIALSDESTKAKIRIRIKSDSYDFQSYARVDVCSPATLSWNRIGEIPYANMSTPFKLGYKQGAGIELFEADFAKLVEQAKIILFD